MTTLRAALAEPERKPLDEEQMNEAYRHIWRNLPSEFDHTASAWIEQGVRYAERAHGIGCPHAASGCNYPEGECLGVCR